MVGSPSGEVAISRLRSRISIPAAVLAVASCLLLAAQASAYVYWASGATGNIGRANLDGSGSSPNFIGGATDAIGVAVDGQHVYWANGSVIASSIGQANLDGSSVNQSLISGAGVPSGWRSTRSRPRTHSTFPQSGSTRRRGPRF
jgi:hypothetical protein